MVTFLASTSSTLGPKQLEAMPFEMITTLLLSILLTLAEDHSLCHKEDFSEKVSPVFTPDNLLDEAPKMKQIIW